jgi:hypothetical protein
VYDVYKWMAITFGAGMALLVIEVMVARRKKEGFTATDAKRCFGILWLSLFATGVVGFLVWVAPD